MEHGAYQVLLDTYYATDGRLPSDPEELYRIARAMTLQERKAVDKVAEQFFAINGDGTRHNHRADKEIATASAYADAQSMRANKRWHMPVHKQVQSPDDASHSHSQKDQKLSPSADGFSEFWALWPRHFRKEAKGKCETVWRRKKLASRRDEILSHVQAMIASQQWQDPQFIPAPLAYLNGEKWDGAEAAPQAVQVDR